MKRFSTVFVLLFLSLFVVSTSAIAVPIAGDALQDLFDTEDFGLNALNDQLLVPEGFTLTKGSDSSSMVLYNKAPANMEFGIYSIKGLQEATVFDSADFAVANANVKFNSAGALVIQWWNNGALYNETTFWDFSGQTFGFWIGDGTKKYYSDAAMNDVNGNGVKGEEADIALLVYNADPGSYIFAGDIDGDRDFMNMVTQAESIKPVPEPATMILFGLGLIGVAGLGRKKLYS